VALATLVTPDAAARPARALDAAADARVAVVLSHGRKAANYPTIEFYQAVTAAVEEASAWAPARASEIRPLLPKPGVDLGSIPTVDRSVFLKAKPNRSAKAGRAPKGALTKRKAARAAQIVPVQRMLDTLAIQGAVIVDCDPRGANEVSACGVYFYDRADGRVVARAQKQFRVGITDASRWATALVATLKDGMSAARANAERKRFDELMERGEEAPDHGVMLAVEAAGERLAVPDARLDAAMNLGLQALVRSSAGAPAFGVEIAQGTSSDDGGKDGAASYRLRRLGLVVDASARAMQSAVWSLGLAAGVADREYNLDETSLRQRGTYVSVRPGLGFRMSESVTLAFDLRHTSYLGGSRTADETFEDDRLGSSAFGLGLRLTAVVF
jgi:hypothetical protein